MSLENRYNSEIKNIISASSLKEDEKIEEIIKNITITHPKNPFTQFVLNEIENFKLKNKDVKFDFQEFSFNCEEKWKNLSTTDKKKYIKLYEDEKLKYKANLEQLRHLLFRDINEPFKASSTAYKIFLNEKLREGFERGCKPKYVKKEASSKWVKMSFEEKKIYDEQKHDNDNWILKA